MKKVLTIAGSDSGGGAGIQADLKTMLANGVFGMSAVTALTAQNTLGITDIMEVTPDFLQQQIDAVFTDMRPDAVKIGMTASEHLIAVIAERLQYYHAENIVLDTVLASTSGTELNYSLTALKKLLLPIADLITPNIPETEILAEMPVRTEQDMLKASEKLSKQFHCAVLCKGGHSASQECNDVLYYQHQAYWFRSEKIQNPNTHGTGCTLSSAIASNLAKGFSMPESVARAKHYLTCALSDCLDLGHGNGPLHHGFAISNEFTEYP